MRHRLERRGSPLGALDLEAAPAFATPPVLTPPTLRWGTWTP
jgi:hypothetical protein